MRKWVSSVLALTLLLAVAGCGQQATDQPGSATPAQPGQTAATTPATPTTPAQPFSLVVAQGADAVTLDPHKTNDQPSARVMRQIYDTLIDQTEELALQPGLATEWRKVDDLTMEFKLRQGVKFHNGETFKASDVKFTFDRLLDPETRAPGAFILSQVAEVVVVDDYTIQIVTKAPFAPILSHLAHTATSILNEQAVKDRGDDYGQNPVGTGPFRFVGWSTGSHINLARFDDHWGEPAKAATVRFRAISEGSTRAIEVETGAVDIAYDLEPADYFRMQAEDKVQLMRDATLSTAYIGFNFRQEPYDKLEVRQAINHAINVDEIIEHVMLNIGQKARGPISPLVWGANPDLQGYDYNPARARELLAAAGYPDGFKTSIWTNDNPVRMQIAEVVQNQLAQIGIEVDVQVIEWGQYLSDTADGKHDMFILGWVTVTGDADYGLYALFHSSQQGSAGNRTFYVNPEVDALLDQGRTTIDEAPRRAAYMRAQELITADAPWLFLNVAEAVTGLGKNIADFRPHPAGHHRLRNVVKN